MQTDNCAKPLTQRDIDSLVQVIVNTTLAVPNGSTLPRNEIVQGRLSGADSDTIEANSLLLRIWLHVQNFMHGLNMCSHIATVMYVYSYTHTS